MFNTKVLSNPFEDIVPREKEKAVESVDTKKEKKKKGTKYVTCFFTKDCQNDIRF